MTFCLNFFLKGFFNFNQIFVTTHSQFHHIKANRT